MRQITDNTGHVVASADMYYSGSSIIQFDVGPVMPSLITLWLTEGQQLVGPDARWFVVAAREGSPWLEVKLGRPDEPREFAIWRATGDIYRVTEGKVDDDPMVTM